MLLQNLDTDLLRAFVTVAETTSFTKASERLFRTQAAVSMQIRRLEDRIGKPVFTRNGRTVCLTGEGDFLLTYAKRILQLNDEVFANMSLPRPDAIVRIGAPDDYAKVLLPESLLAFRREFRDTQLEVVCDNSVDLIREVRAGRLDLALVTRPPNELDGELIRQEKMYWVTARENSPHEANPLPLALFPHGCVCRDLALRALRDTDKNWKIVFSSGTIAAILAAVGAGLAISAVEESVIPIGARRLGVADGFPELPSVDIALYQSPDGLRGPAAELARNLRRCLRRQVAGSLDDRSHTIARHRAGGVTQLYVEEALPSL
jgi:DNA-binding transcriptional LysR family regulator